MNDKTRKCPKCHNELRLKDPQNYYCFTCNLWNPDEWWFPEWDGK